MSSASLKKDSRTSARRNEAPNEGASIAATVDRTLLPPVTPNESRNARLDPLLAVDQGALTTSRLEALHPIPHSQYHVILYEKALNEIVVQENDDLDDISHLTELAIDINMATTSVHGFDVLNQNQRPPSPVILVGNEFHEVAVQENNDLDDISRLTEPATDITTPSTSVHCFDTVNQNQRPPSPDFPFFHKVDPENVDSDDMSLLTVPETETDTERMYVENVQSKAVLAGRGDPTNNHFGNRWFHTEKNKWVEEYWQAGLAAKGEKNKAKAKVAQALVDSMRLKYGTRFLDFEEDAEGRKRWYVQSNKRTLVRVKQALCEAVKEWYR